MAYRHTASLLPFVFLALLHLHETNAGTIEAQGATAQPLQIELSVNNTPQFENAFIVELSLRARGLFGASTKYPVSSESLQDLIRLKTNEKNLVLYVGIDDGELSMTTLRRAVSDISTQKPAVPTHVFFCPRLLFDEKIWKEMGMPTSKAQKIQISLVLEKPKTKKGPDVFLRKEGLVDMNGKAISNQNLRKILGPGDSNNGQKDFHVFVVIERNNEIKMADLAKAVGEIYAELDPALRTQVFIVLQNPDREKEKGKEKEEKKK
jgi:hypothetical protein